MLIFNFHHVEADVPDSPRKHITISQSGLRQFIRTLRAMRIEIVSLKDFSNTPEAAQTHKRQAILTFDDGYTNNYEFAAPILTEEQCPATIFVLPGRFGGTNEWDQGHLPEAERDRLMTLEQMQELAESPYITFGSHGMRHRNLPELDDAELEFELNESYQILSTHIGDSFVPIFAYPWGYYSPRVIEHMEQSPYQYGLTVQNGQWEPSASRFEIPRYSVFFRDGNPVMLFAKLCRHGLLFS